MASPTETFSVLDILVDRIVASIDEEIETAGVPPRAPQASELTRRPGGLSPRPLAHALSSTAPITAKPSTSSGGAAARSYLRARIFQALLHQLP